MNIIASLLRRSEKRRTYSHLVGLDDRLLRDIGLNRADLHLMMVGVRTVHGKPRLDHD
jgi:uncharacterized protein YjiS (DUF1127 family)